MDSDLISKTIIAIVSKLFNTKLDFVLVQKPENPKFGDYAVNTAMLLAKKLKQNPVKIAEAIAEELMKNKDFAHIKVEVVHPGFINIFLADSNISDKVVEIAKKGLLGAKEKTEKIIVEHTAVNPNKAMHVGHLRNSCIGDSIAKVLKYLGYKVEVENYIDDTGVQVADSFLGIKKYKKDQGNYKKFDHFAWDVYSKIYKQLESDEKLKSERDELLKKMEEGDNDLEVWNFVNKIISAQLETMELFNIEYDLLVSESAIIHSGLLGKAINKLKETGEFVKETEGENKEAWVIKNVVEGQDLKNPDKILVKSDGVTTYTGKDVALHLWKFGLADFDFKYKKVENKNTSITSIEGKYVPGFGEADRIVNVIDVRQSYPQEVVKKCLEKLGFEKQAKNYNHVAYEVVSLSRETAKKLGVDVSDNKKEYPMSGRKGVGVKTDDLYDQVLDGVKEKQREGKRVISDVAAKQVAVGAIKFYMLKFGLNKIVAFDIDDALNFEGDTGPYIQYTHARICGILKKAGISDLGKLEIKLPEEKSIARLLMHFDEVVASAGEKLEPIGIANYLIDLCHEFNSFYQKVPVLKAEEEEKKSRIVLISAVAKTLSKGLELLGIEAPEEM